MNLVDGGGSIDGFGIDLKLNSIEAEEFYCETLRIWFEDDKGYHALSTTGLEFILNDGFNDLSIVYIENSILRMKALSEDPYETLISLLEFIANNHKKTIEVFNYLEGDEQESLSWATSNSPDEAGEEEPEIESEEDSDGWV